MSRWLNARIGCTFSQLEIRCELSAAGISDQSLFQSGEDGIPLFPFDIRGRPGDNVAGDAPQDVGLSRFGFPQISFNPLQRLHALAFQVAPARSRQNRFGGKTMLNT